MGKMRIGALGKKRKVLVPIIVAISVVIALVGGILGAILLLKPAQKTYNGKLSTPENLIVQKTETANGYQYFAKYDEVAGADRYIVYINDEFSHSSTSTMVDITKYITEAKTYVISVQAINNRISSYNSDKTSIDFQNKLKLQTPQVTRTNKVFLWSAVSNANAYNVEFMYGNVKNEEQIESSTYDFTRFLTLTQNDPTITDFTFRVQAVYMGSMLWENSEFSETAEYHVVKNLEDVDLIHYTENTTINQNPVTKHKIEWSSCRGADNYEIYLSHNGGSFDLIRTVGSDSFMFDLTNYLDGVGTYTAHVKATSNNEYITSSVSNDISFIVSQKIATPINVQAVLSGEYVSVSWQPGDERDFQTYYSVVVSNGTTVVHDAAVAGTNYDFLLIVNRLGYYSITITAKNQNQPELLVDSDPSEPVVLVVSPKLNAPTNIAFKQDVPGALSSLSWSRVENASSYAVQLYTLDNNEKVEYGQLNYVTTTSFNLPFNSAGYYYAKVKAVVEGGFYKDSDFSDFVECKFMTVLATPQNFALNESTLVLTWETVENAFAYGVYINKSLVDDIVYEIDGTIVSVTNLGVILSDVSKYPSNETTPYEISVRALGEQNGVYANSDAAVVQHFVTRQLNAPTNLSYTQQPNTNNVSLSWDAVEHATRGYTVYINGSAPTDLQSISALGCEIGPFLLPGTNKIQVMANKSPNYSASDFASFDEDPTFTYYMQSAKNVNVLADVKNGNTTYTVTFETHRYANHYIFSFYGDELLTQQLGTSHVESVYYTNNEVVSFVANYDCIKRTGDCLTYIKVVTAYESSLPGSTATNFDANYIVGDGVTLAYPKSATSVVVYENDTVLLNVANETIESFDDTSFTISFEYLSSLINMGKVKWFELTLITIDAVNGNSYAVPVVVQTNERSASQNVGYSKYYYTFSNISIGQYQVRIKAVSNNPAKVSDSSFAYISFKKTMHQPAPQNLTIFRSTEPSTNGNVIMQWDAIESVSQQLPPTYDASLYFFDPITSESILIQSWTDLGYNNLVIARGASVVKILRINLSTAKYVGNQQKAVEEFLVSGLYYMTVRANALSEYYLESEVSTMARENYYQHDATLTPPTIYLNNENDLFIPYIESVYYELRYSFGESGVWTVMQNVGSSLALYNNGGSNIKCLKYNIKSYFANGFTVGQYNIVAFAKRDVEVNSEMTTLTSLPSNIVVYALVNKFGQTTIESTKFDYVYNQTRADYISRLTIVWDLVTEIGTNNQPVVATDYEISISKGSFNKKFVVNSIDGTDSYKIKVLDNNVWTEYTYINKTNGICTFEYNSVLGFTTQIVENGTQFKFEFYNLEYLTSGVRYDCNIRALERLDLFFADSELSAYTTFTYKSMWNAPTLAFIDEYNQDISTQFVETKNGASVALHINPLVGANQTSTVDWLFAVTIKNLLTDAEERTISPVTGINVAGVTGRVYFINANEFKNAGLYKIEVKIVNSSKYESPNSNTVYVYNSIDNASPTITKVAKASTFYGSTDINNIAIEWIYFGFDNLTNASPSFTFTLTEINEDGTTVAGGFSGSTILPANTLSYQNGKYSAVIDLSIFANPNDFFWSKNWGVGETVTNYSFDIIANAFSTDLTQVYANLVSEGETEGLITPSTSAKFNAASKLYEFNENSVPVGYVIRRDNALNAPSGFTFNADNDSKTINWTVVSDPSGDYVVGYKYVYYTVTTVGKYYLHTNSGSDPIQIKFDNGRVLKFDDNSEISFLKNASNFWFNVEQNTFSVETNVATVFGVWMFAYPVDSESISTSSSISFNIVSYTQPVLLPDELFWETTVDNSVNAIYFENLAAVQFSTPTVTLYKQLYTITLGGHVIDWVVDADKLGSITATDEQFRVVVSGLYNISAFAENTDETGTPISRQYSFDILASDYYINAFDPTNPSYQSSVLLYQTNNVNGIVYKPVVIQRNVADAQISLENSRYFAAWEEISLATKYELLLVDQSNVPIRDDVRYFVNNTVPSNYVEKLNVSMIDGVCTYVEDGVLHTVEIQITSGLLRTVKVDITPLLNLRPAATYYLAIYAVADEQRHITTNGNATTATKSFVFRKQYQAIDADTIIFTTDDEGLLQTISWEEKPNPDGGWVHDDAYFRFTIWDTNHESQNPVLYELDGSGHRFASLCVSNLSGAQTLDNLIGAPLFSFDNDETFGPRMVFDVEQLFKTYLINSMGARQAGAYTIGIQIFPVNTAASSYEPSLTTQKDFVYKVKLELDENTNYVTIMIDSCLNQTASQITHEIVFKDTEAETKAQDYLDNAMIANNFNLKSVLVDSWLPATQSVAFEIYMNIDGKWKFCGGIDDVLTSTLFLLSGSQISLNPGENQLAIKALGINENYLSSEFKVITFTLFYKHPTPVVEIDENNTQYADNGQTLTHIFLKLSGVATQNYDVVVNAYRVVNNENVLAFTTPTDSANRIMWVGELGQFVYKSTYEIVEKRGQAVNFIDFFRANAGVIFGNSEYQHYELYSLIGAYEYVFTARIYASTNETYMLNGDESNPTSTLNYTHKLQTPIFAETVNEDSESVKEFLVRDADEQITSAKIKIRLDNPGFKTVIDYSVNIWDVTNDDVRYLLNNNDTMRYTARVVVDFNTLNEISYTLDSVTYAAYMQTPQYVASGNVENYFTIENGYLVFELMNFVDNNNRANNYLAGKYHYNVRAALASNYYLNDQQYVLNTNLNIYSSDYAFETEISDDEEPYTMYYEYIHRVPYPVLITSANVDENGLLAIRWQDKYKTATGFEISVNDVVRVFELENVNNNELMTYNQNISDLLVPGMPNVVKVNVQQVGYYEKGKQLTATLDFVVWTHEILTIRNLSWSDEEGKQTLSFSTEFYDIYKNDDRLMVGGKKAGRVHFALEVLYLSNFDVDTSGLNSSTVYELFKQQDGVEMLYIPNLSAPEYQWVEFVSDARAYYENLNLNELIGKTTSAEQWLVAGSLRGGYYALKLTGTVKNEDGTYAENSNTESFLDCDAYIPTRYVMSPWQITGSIDLWDNMGGNVAAKSTQTANERNKEIWADNIDEAWGVCFDVPAIKAQHPTSYKVYYFRDTSSTVKDEAFAFVVTGENVTYEGNKAWLNFQPYFNKNTVKQGGIYNFIITALKVDNIASGSAYVGLLSAVGQEIAAEMVASYASFGLQHFVRLTTPQLGETLYQQQAQSTIIKVDSRLAFVESEDLFTEQFVLTNFRGNNFVDGQDFPTDATPAGQVTFVGDSFAHNEKTNADLQLKYGENYVSVQSVALGTLSEFYLDSPKSNLKLYVWEVNVNPPKELQISFSNFTNEYQDFWIGWQVRTVPENVNPEINGNQSGTHSDGNNSLANVGGVRSQSAEFDQTNNITYQDYFTITTQVSAAETLVDGITELELRVFDPVINPQNDDRWAIAYMLIKVDTNTGKCYFEKMASLGLNAVQETLIDMHNAEIGVCSVKYDDVNIAITGLKVYQLFPSIRYEGVDVQDDINDPTIKRKINETKDYAAIPQTYNFKINSIAAGIYSQSKIVPYNYSLRLLTPEISAENGVQFGGSSIVSSGNDVYIKDSSSDDYGITVEVDKISRNAIVNHSVYLKLYACVDSTAPTQGRTTNGISIKDYYLNGDGADYYANFTPGYSAFNSQYTNCCKIFIIGEESINFTDSGYGSVTLEINKNDLLWKFINFNTPNTFEFYVQVFTGEQDASSYIVHEDGDLYLARENSAEIIKRMSLRYTESYISSRQTYTIKRQFVAAPIDLRFDYGQLGAEEIFGTLDDQSQTQTINGNKSNLQVVTDIALDPYLVIKKDSYQLTRQSILSYEYDETMKYVTYEVKVSCGSQTSEVRTFTTDISDPDNIDYGLFETISKFDEVARNNLARYTFDNGYKDKHTLNKDTYCLYDLFASVCSDGNGGTCTLSIRAVKNENTNWINGNPNLWVSQNDDNWTTRTVEFFTRPDAVELTLGDAVFDTNNPLCVRWQGETEENELLYPNNIPLSWTQSSANFGSYTIDVTRSAQTQNSRSFALSNNQGTANFNGTQVNLADPKFNNAQNSGYDSNMESYARFNYWDKASQGNSSNRVPGQTVPYYDIVVQPNGNKANHVGKGYRSGANDEGVLAAVTHYYMQLKYNIGSFHAESECKQTQSIDKENEDVYEVSNFKTFTMTIPNRSGQTAVLNKENGSKYGFVVYTFVDITGHFSATINNKGEYTLDEERTIRLQATSNNTDWVPYITDFSVEGLANKILAFLEHIDALGGEYSFSIYFSAYQEDGQEVDITKIPYIKSETSDKDTQGRALNTFKYYRLVEDGGLEIQDVESISANNPAPVNDEEDEMGNAVTYGVRFKATKNLSEYEKYVGEYSIVMEQIDATKKTRVLSNPVASFIAYDSVGTMSGAQTRGAATNPYTYQNFDGSKADVLTSATITESDASKFIENGYTYNVGSLQGGKNTYIYKITAGDEAYNLPFRKRIACVYSVPANFMPSIPTEIDYRMNTEDGQILVLNDYYEVPLSYNNTFTQPSSSLAYGANYDLYYTLHSKTLSGFAESAGLIYKNVYSYSYEFKYDTLSIESDKQKVSQYSGTTEYTYDYYKKQSEQIEETTHQAELKNGQPFSIVIDEKKNPLCSDTNEENALQVNFSKLGENIKVIKVSEFKFSVKCLPGFASVFKTDTDHQWDRGNAGTISQTYNSGENAQKAQLSNAQKTQVKYATVNVQHVFQYGGTNISIWSTGTTYTINIGTKTPMKLQSKFSTKVRYFNIPVKSISFGNLMVTQSVTHTNTWFRKHTDWWGIGGSDVTIEGGTGTQTVGPVSADLKFDIGLSNENNNSSGTNNSNGGVTIGDLVLRPADDSGGIFDSWADKYYDEKATISVSARSVSCSAITVGNFLIPEKEGTYNPLRHDSAGLQQYLFGTVTTVEEAEREACKNCHGTTYESTCSTCHGSCLAASGQGFCPTCLGTGREPCKVCNSNWCQGYETDCTTCGGNKQLLCKRCAGQGYFKFERAFKTYTDLDGSVKEVDEWTSNGRKYRTYFYTSHTYTVGCPDCGGSGVNYDDWDRFHTNDTYNKVYYDIDTGTIKMGNSEISKADRTKEIVKGSGHVACYACSGGSRQGEYNKDGSIKTPAQSSSNSAPNNHPETAQFIYTACGCDECQNNCDDDNCQNCCDEHCEQTNVLDNTQNTTEGEKQNPLSKNIVDKQVETNGQQPEEDNTPLQYAENIMQQAKAKNDDDIIFVEDSIVCFDTAC